MISSDLSYPKEKKNKELEPGFQKMALRREREKKMQLMVFAALLAVSTIACWTTLKKSGEFFDCHK